MNFLSPGVYSQETDISQVVQLRAGTVSALVAAAPKGPLGPKLISTDKEFVEVYGNPNPTVSLAHYSALAVLRQGGPLYFNRVVDSATYGILAYQNTGTSEGLFSETALSDPTAYAFEATDIFILYPVGPGTGYSNLRIKISESSATDQELTISVYDASNPNVMLETFRVAMTRKKDGHGRQMFIEDVINVQSNLIRAKYNTTTSAAIVLETLGGTENNLAFSTASDGNAVGDDEIIAGWDTFKDASQYSVSLLINGGYATANVQNKMLEVAAYRDDCVALLDIPSASQAVEAAKTYRTDTLNANSSYGALLTPDYKTYDEYNDIELYVPPSGEVAARAVYTDSTRDPWIAIAGLNRGVFNNCRGLRVNYSQADRDELYKNQINFVIANPGEGYALFGQRTLLSKSSSLSELTIRRLLCTIKPAMNRAARSSLFEPNDEFLQSKIKQMLDEYLQQVKNRRGLYDYRVVCDSTNNTPATIDNNQLNVDVYLKPTRTAEVIKLQSVLTTTGASFQELIATGGNF